MDYHNWIYRTRWLMAEVETAMKRLTKYMEEYGTLPNLFCTGESEAGTIMRKSGELRHKLRGVYYGIADNWLRIIENVVLRDEVARHLAGYAGLKDASPKLRLALKDSPETERNLFGESQPVDRLNEFFDDRHLFSLDGTVRSARLDKCDYVGRPPACTDSTDVDAGGRGRRRSRRRSRCGARSSLSQLTGRQLGKSAGRNLIEWKSEPREVWRRLEPSLSDGAPAEEEGLDRFDYDASGQTLRRLIWYDHHFRPSVRYNPAGCR